MTEDVREKIERLRDYGLTSYEAEVICASTQTLVRDHRGAAGMTDPAQDAVADATGQKFPRQIWCAPEGKYGQGFEAISLRSWSPQPEYRAGVEVEYTRTDLHDAELTRLRAENETLTRRADGLVTDYEREFQELRKELEHAKGMLIASYAECSKDCDDPECPYTHKSETWQERAKELGRELAEARAAAAEAKAMGGVRVRKLEWKKSLTAETLRSAETSYGTYRTWTHHEADGRWFWGLAAGNYPDAGSGGSEQEVTAVAEAHHERRVLAQLEPAPAPALFVRQDFIGSAGGKLTWKIECNALSDEDWRTIASVAAPTLPGFREVLGVPRGGLKLATAFAEYADPNANGLLIVDDVWTTGKSIQQFAEGRGCTPILFVAFDRSARGDAPHAFMRLVAAPAPADKIECETNRLIARIKEMARSIGAEFHVDPEKLATFIAAERKLAAQPAPAPAGPLTLRDLASMPADTLVDVGSSIPTEAKEARKPLVWEPDGDGWIAGDYIISPSLEDFTLLIGDGPTWLSDHLTLEAAQQAAQAHSDRSAAQEGV